MPFEGFRRNPFSLKLDWVARRLFWVEDGPTVRLVCAVDHGLRELNVTLVSTSRFVVQRLLFLLIWRILHQLQKVLLKLSTSKQQF